MAVGQRRIESGDDIFGGHKGLDIVDGGEDEPTTRRQIINTPLNLVAYLVRCTEREHPLGIDAATPEDDIITVGSLQSFGIHAFGRDLHRINDVEAQVDEVGDEIIDRTATMEEQFGIRFFPDGICQAAPFGLDHLLVQFG